MPVANVNVSDWIIYNTASTDVTISVSRVGEYIYIRDSVWEEGPRKPKREYLFEYNLNESSD